MDSLDRILGVERDVDEVVRVLKYHLQRAGPPVVGALLVTCSDEAERECAEAFQRWFADELLPAEKSWLRAPFRTASLGGRYEWGSVRVAEDHYAGVRPGHAFKALVVKVNGHVAIDHLNGRPVFGAKRRYQQRSTYCGALNALLDGQAPTHLNGLAEDLSFEHFDRLTLLRDPAQVAPELRSLYAAVASARLQARKAVLDIQDHTPASPTLYLVVPCVTLNRDTRDGDLVCGYYTADYRQRDSASVTYIGLSDNPRRFQAGFHLNRLFLTEEGGFSPREARDHRRHMLESVHAEMLRPPREPRLDEALEKAATWPAHDVALGREVLKTLLWLLADVFPIPIALLMFGKGVVGIHHVYRVHRLAKGLAGEHAARELLDEAGRNVATLPPEKVHDALRALTVVMGRGGSRAGKRPAGTH